MGSFIPVTQRYYTAFDRIKMACCRSLVSHSQREASVFFGPIIYGAIPS